MEAFRELFGAIALHALMAMLALCVAFAAARFLWRRACALAWIRRTGGCVMALALGLVTSVCVVKGSAKPLRRTGDGPPCQITAEDISNGWRVAETREGRALSRPFDGVATNISWMLRGTYSDVVRIEPPLWSFPWRDGVLGGVTVLSWGEVRPAIASSYFPEPFPCRVSLTPKRNWHLIPPNAVPYDGDATPTNNESIFWHGVTPSNSLVVTWQNALYGRQASCPTNFQAEFFADGCFDYRYQDRTVEYVPVFPFDWDGDGLENSVDPDPLAAGPDAHGTNAEWYNVVCSNVFVAAEGDAPASGDMRPPGLILSPGGRARPSADLLRRRRRVEAWRSHRRRPRRRDEPRPSADRRDIHYNFLRAVFRRGTRGGVRHADAKRRDVHGGMASRPRLLFRRRVVHAVGPGAFQAGRGVLVVRRVLSEDIRRHHAIRMQRLRLRRLQRGCDLCVRAVLALCGCCSVWLHGRGEHERGFAASRRA